MPIIFLEAENVIDRIHRSSVISYRNIIKKMDAYKAQYPGKEMSDIEAAHLVAAELGIKIEFEACRRTMPNDCDCLACRATRLIKRFKVVQHSNNSRKDSQ